MEDFVVDVEDFVEVDDFVVKADDFIEEVDDFAVEVDDFVDVERCVDVKEIEGEDTLLELILFVTEAVDDGEVLVTTLAGAEDPDDRLVEALVVD